MAKARVLIVEDQPNWRALFSDLLEDEYDVTSVGSYKDALEALKRDSPFRVAVVDIRLDDQDPSNEDGLRLLEDLKGVTSVVVTGYPTVRTTKKALSLGAHDYIEKYPEDGKDFNAETFRRIVRDAMSRFAFVVMPFAEEYKDIYEDAVKRTVETKGLDCKRADDFRDPSWIMDDVRRCIDRAQFLIADLSGRRPNVFYEVGMAHALHKTVILLTQDPNDVPPKLKGIRYIRYQDSAGGKEELERSLAQTLDSLRRKNFFSRPVFPQETDLVDPKRCLVLTTLADPIRKEAYAQIVRKAATECGLTCENIQGIFATRRTMDAIWTCLNQARVVVTDLSSGDADIFYLTGIAHGLRKDVILLAQSEEEIPFDLGEQSYLIYATKPYKKAREDTEALVEIIRKMLKKATSSKTDGGFARGSVGTPKQHADFKQTSASTTGPDTSPLTRINEENLQQNLQRGHFAPRLAAYYSQTSESSTAVECAAAEQHYADFSFHVDPDNPPIAIIRELLTSAFTPSMLHRFCQDDPHFCPLVSKFGPKHNLEDMVQEVITFCETYLLWNELLAKTKEENPRQYGRFAPRIKAYYRGSSSSNAGNGRSTIKEHYADFFLHIGPDGHARAVSAEGERTATISLTIPTNVGLTISLIEQDQTDAELKAFGTQLYNIIFPPEVDTHFNQTEAVARTRNHKVRIRLTIEPDALAQLPWEFMYREEGSYFLATNPNTVLSLYLDLPLPQGYVRQREGPLHMLAIISNPTDQSVQLDVAEWEGIVRQALTEPIQQGLLTLRVVKQATLGNIKTALLAQPPNIVQFVGHGVYQAGKGYLALVNENGGTWEVDDERFAALFAGVQDRLGLVCLTTCESAKSDSPKSFLGIAPRLVQWGTPAVVAMRYPVLVSTAAIFLENFYTALASRKPVDWAVQWARYAISIQVGMDNREFATPVLFMRAKDGDIF
jgi:ActR/RegA family two-component response regulator/CHAT domain-containing protein